MWVLSLNHLILQLFVPSVANRASGNIYLWHNQINILSANLDHSLLLIGVRLWLLSAFFPKGIDCTFETTNLQIKFESMLYK